jgi:cell division protein FtsX
MVIHKRESAMNLRYMTKELYYQRRRTLMSILGLSIGIALLIVLNSLSLAYRQAAHVPLKEIGADITVQRSGDVPKERSFPVQRWQFARRKLRRSRNFPA